MNYLDPVEYEPVPYLLDKAKKTDIPLIYLNKEPEIFSGKPLVFFLIGPSGSGKDSLAGPLFESGDVVHAVTATSRMIRNEEDPARYVWMRQQRENESEQDYDKNLIKEYNLIEHDRHFSNLYGLPAQELERAMQQKTPPLIRTEPRGVRSILNYLKDKASCVVIFIVPESFAQVWERAQDRVDFNERKWKAVEEVQEAPFISNYYIFNPVEFNGTAGLPQAQESLKKLIMIYSNHVNKKTIDLN